MARGRGEGSISKRPDGTWCARVSTGYDDDGNLKRKAFYGKSRKEVHDKMTAALNEMRLNKGRYVDPKKTTLADWLDVWLKEYKAKSLRNASLRLCYDCVNIHIKPFFGAVTLDGLKSLAVQRFSNALHEKGYSLSYRKQIVSKLRQALNVAIDNDLIVKNPAKGVVIHEGEPEVTEKDILTPEEQVRFVEEARKYNQYGEAFLLMLATGMRIGEVLALTWNDVDFEKGEISVTKGLQRNVKIGDLVPEPENPLELGPTKTRTSVRTVPLLKDALELLKNKKRWDVPNEKNLLFISKTGGLPRAEYYREIFKLIVHGAGIEKNITPHSLRHTFATRGLESGIELIVMQKILGHSNLKMTADIYTHVLPEKKHDSMTKLEEVIKL